MKKTNKSLKEWNAIVEALGQGLQTILIRSYPTNADGFLLYPTFSYTMKEDYLTNFKENFRTFVQDNALPIKKGDKTEIKYYAKVEKVIEKSSRQIISLDQYHIWNNNHVKNYLLGKTGFIWLLRIYKLNESYMAEKNRGMKYANLNKYLKISNLKPVINNKTFFDSKAKIMN